MEIASSSSVGVSVEELSSQKRQIYYKLRGIFPNINPEYVKTILIDTPPEVRQDLGIENMTNDLVEHLLVYGDEHVNLRTISWPQNYWELQVCSSPQMQFDRLVGIFPDADPDFLSKFVKKFYKNAQKINDFIEQNLEHKSYPTREEYVARKKLEEEYCKYFTEFDIKKFLAEFPDPFKYFEGEERKCKEDTAVYDLLCDRFQNLELSVISTQYRNCKFNPTVTSKRLEELKNGAKSTFANALLKKLDTQNFPEFAFICNRQNIEEYLQKIKKEEEEALQELKGKNELLHCECCLNDFVPAKCSTCVSGHIFCNDCISFGTECSIADAKYTIRCFENCSSIFSLKTLKKVLKPKVYSTLVKKQQEEELAAADIGNLENCPFCDFKSIINEGDKIFTCMNEDCKKQSCRRCKQLNHLPYECSDVFDVENARLYLEEKMTKALVRTCYECKKEFVKLHGCNRMNCFCGAVMCYICDKPVSATDYKHFNTQGSDRCDLCPLYSDDHRQEAEAVIEVAKATKREIEKRNPNINLDNVDKLLPVLPPKTSGPHEQVSNSDQIPEHALKVAKAIPP